ncbi:replicative DNA helicase [Thiolinea disciformis]|uniref:replicative DNA helicase n=1 Tax=Thiolinea disciformis TaxID=125614 RepID=UPI0003A079EC|nr:replicative DNA helicase [Thiolinea disciformis]
MADTYETLKIPPHSIEAEQWVIGGLLMNPDAYISVAGIVREDDFYRNDHRLIFKAVALMTQDQQPIDLLTLSEYAKKHGMLEDVGGFHYLGTLCNSTASAANVVAHAKIVREKSLLRRLISVGTSIADMGFSLHAQHADLGSQAQVAEAIAKAAQLVFELETDSIGSEREFVKLKDALKAQLGVIQTLANLKGDEPIRGYSTGWKTIDRRSNGLEKGFLYYVAARPAMGKTSFLLNMAEAVSLEQLDKLTVIFSMEMTEGELAEKFIAASGGANFAHLRNPSRAKQASDFDALWANIAMGVKRIGNSNIYLDCSSVQSPSTVRSRLRRLAHQTGLPVGCVFLDYLQLMEGDKERYQNRDAEIGDISRSLKRLAKDFNVPVVVGAQLNRELERRPNKRPIMSDIRESGSVEQDANMIWGLYRDEVYNPDTPDKGIAEIITLKGRSEAIGTDRLVWQGQFQRFRDYVPEEGGAWR